MYKFILTFIALININVNVNLNAQDVNVVVQREKGVRDSGCGVCIKVDKQSKTSYVLTCNHIYTQYPTPTKIQFHNKNYKAQAIAGDKERDLALVVVEGVLQTAELADEDSKPGTNVYHEGSTSGPANGVVLPKRLEYNFPASWFTSTLSAISGDSGSAVYDTKTNKVVAILAGRVDIPENAPMRGCPVSEIKVFLAKHMKEK